MRVIFVHEASVPMNNHGIECAFLSWEKSRSLSNTSQLLHCQTSDIFRPSICCRYQPRSHSSETFSAGGWHRGIV